MSVMKKSQLSNLQDTIIQICAKRFDLTVNEFLTVKTRNPENVLRRYMAYYLIKNNTFLSNEAISSIFGCCGENAVRYGIDKVGDYLFYEKRVIAEIKQIQEMIDNFTKDKEKSYVQAWLTQ